MTSSLDLEIKVVERFVLKIKQDRYLTLIKGEKSRYKFIKELSHFVDFRTELFEEVKGDVHQFVKDRTKSLRQFHDCYLISELSKLDQKRLSIDKALNEIIGCGMGTLLVFGDAEIVYYEGEAQNNRWISKLVEFV